MPFLEVFSVLIKVTKISYSVYGISVPMWVFYYLTSFIGILSQQPNALEKFLIIPILHIQKVVNYSIASTLQTSYQQSSDLKTVSILPESAF